MKISTYHIYILKISELNKNQQNKLIKTKK